MEKRELPEGWEWKKLEEIAEINPKFQNKSLSDEIDVTFLPMRCVEGCTGRIDTSLIKKFRELKSGYTPIQEGDLLFAKITPCIENGKIAIARHLKNGIGFASTEFHTLRFYSGYDVNFFQYFLMQDRIRQNAARNMTGTAGQQRVPVIFLKKLNVPVPPLPVQHRIVEILEQADALRRLRVEADFETQKLLQSVFYEMFGDPVKNEKGWPNVKLGKICTDIQNGLYLPKEKYVPTGGVEMVHMSDAFYGQVIIGNLKRVNATLEEIEKYKLSETDLLVARRSLNYEGAAKACMIPPLKDLLLFESSLIKIRPNLDLVLPKYLFGYINSPLVRKAFIENYISKSTISGINQENLKNITVLLPPLNLQKKYDQITGQIGKICTIQKQSIEDINNLFNLFLTKSFTGDLII
jgi:type I restriction enzyme, S subunit